MMTRHRALVAFASLTALSFLLGQTGNMSFAQTQDTQAAAATDASQAAAPLSEDELEVLVARIALYPDELVAVICGASLYPLQIVEASRFLADYEKNKSLKPKDSWDDSVISLLNYPDILKMMSSDLDWTQSLADALGNQQKDVLVAIQQLRDEAVAKGVIKTDDKIKVTQENNNVVIKSADPQKIYIPQYQPEMLYEPNYAPAPISYYPDPYPNYYYPTATFFSGFVTGAVWGAVVDWNDWGVWGGHWGGNDIDIDCDHCFNNRDFNGKINMNDVDWKNVDRSKIKFDKNQFNKIDSNRIGNSLKANNNNSLRQRATNISDNRSGNLAARTGNGSRDVRKNTLDGLKGKGGNGALARPNAGSRPAMSNKGGSRPNISKPNAGKAAHSIRPSGKAKPGARVDHRPRQASGLGSMQGGKREKIASQRGRQSIGGGMRGGGGRQFHGGGGGRHGGGGRRR